MTNEEKAIELAENISPYDIGGDNAAHYAAKDAALDAMDWKDKQFEEDKQKLIDKAAEWLFKNTRFTTNDIRDFKQAMKGE
jgi:hypothetical protein